ncbi:aspartate aminotransferase [Amycolatopsis echigonensis]|uniref:Aminotransferase n=1 Tax=Amycolatopsis echigonensis TaxID=2576905 RepID=A0A2N3X1Q9_9PSEU|nr:aminotransferase class I/II-fold pyridoxal phosphate-dependent enzyme [Amycolatopsis niigatensis]PKW00058.1 aspartate aminotransferase [Amycolatopsis niigatensis]
MVSRSATLALNDAINARRATGEDIIHLGFGEAGLPVLPEAAAALADGAGQNSYTPVAGTVRAREAVAGYLSRGGLPTDASQILLAPGSKALLYAALSTLPGDVVLPVPSWVTYAAQAQLAGKRTIPVPIPGAAGGVPDPELLTSALAAARARGADPRILILTLPDNPTGTVAGPALVQQVCELADRHGLTVVCDEIYRDLAYDPAAVQSPAALLPDRTIVTGGLSKTMALGGWRIGFLRVPEGSAGHRIADGITALGSELWSCLAGPMQAAAAYVFDSPPPVLEHVQASRRLHATVAHAAHDIFAKAGISCRRPQAAFYLYPDLEVLRPELAARGIRTGVALADHLLEEHGIGVLAGEHFGDAPEQLRFRAATSLLYGRTADERWTALRSTDPVSLPWISAALERLDGTLRALGSK